MKNCNFSDTNGVFVNYTTPIGIYFYQLDTKLKWEEGAEMFQQV